jgi:hypothetical protein
MRSIIAWALIAIVGVAGVGTAYTYNIMAGDETSPQKITVIPEQPTKNDNDCTQPACPIGGFQTYFKNLSIESTPWYDNTGDLKIIDQFTESLDTETLFSTGTGKITAHRDSDSNLYHWFSPFTINEAFAQKVKFDVTTTATPELKASGFFVRFTAVYENGTNMQFMTLTEASVGTTVHAELYLPATANESDAYILKCYVQYRMREVGTLTASLHETFSPAVGLPPALTYHKTADGAYTKNATIQPANGNGNSNKTCCGVATVSSRDTYSKVVDTAGNIAAYAQSTPAIREHELALPTIGSDCDAVCTWTLVDALVPDGAMASVSLRVVLPDGSSNTYSVVNNNAVVGGTVSWVIPGAPSLQPSSCHVYLIYTVYTTLTTATTFFQWSETFVAQD